MSIFPESINSFTQGEVGEETLIYKNDLPLACEYDWDMENNRFIMENGEYRKVYGDDAIKVWIYKILRTPRYRHAAYEWNYGNEFETIIQKGISSELIHVHVKRYLKECLLENPYILRIKDIDISFEDDNLDIEFVAETIYKEVKISV